MITWENIAKGLQNTVWRYRLEIFHHQEIYKIMPQNSIFYIDGAHNISGAKVVADFLKQETFNDGISNYIINGRTKDTDSKNFLIQFKDIIKMVIAIRSNMEAISESPEIIQKAANAINLHCSIGNSIQDAINLIVKYENNITHNYENYNIQDLQKPVRIVLCGSLYLVKML